MSNGNTFAYTYISGNLNLDVVPTKENGYGINGENVLTASNTQLNINQSNAYNTLNLNGTNITANGVTMSVIKGAIPSSTDFNTITNTGVYYCNSKSVATTLVNCPNNIQGMLEVWNIGGVGETENDTSFIIQRYTTLMNKEETADNDICGIYIRTYDKTTNKWTYWQTIYAYNYANGTTYYYFNQTYNPAPNTYPTNPYNGYNGIKASYIVMPKQVESLGKQTTALLLNQQEQNKQISETSKQTVDLALTNMQTQKQSSSIGKVISSISLNNSKTQSNVDTIGLQTETIGKKLTETIVNNTKLKSKNSELGKIISDLDLKNAQLQEQNILLKEQVKALAEIMVKQTLGGK